MEATRPTLDVKGKEGMSVLAKMWREMDAVSQKPWNDKARAGQEKAKADFERWKGMSPDERLVHFPPSPSLGPSPPPPPPADAKPSKKRATSDAGLSSEKKKKKKKSKKKRDSAADPDADTQL
jgi:hypothetical protein